MLRLLTFGGPGLASGDSTASRVRPIRLALRAEIDAANLYVTRTELHELLARAFDAAGERDSAAVHYRAVVNA